MTVKFTPQDEAKVRAWLAQGVSLKQCSQRMHQNHETVRRWAAKHGLHPGQSVATPPVIPDPPEYLPPEPDIWALWMEAMFTVRKRQAKP